MHCSCCRQWLYPAEFSNRQRNRRLHRRRCKACIRVGGRGRCKVCTRVGGQDSSSTDSNSIVINIPTETGGATSIVFGNPLRTDVGKSITSVSLWFLIRLLNFFEPGLVDIVVNILDVMLDKVIPRCDFRKITSPWVWGPECGKMIPLDHLEAIDWKFDLYSRLERCSLHTCPCEMENLPDPELDFCYDCGTSYCVSKFCNSCNCSDFP